MPWVLADGSPSGGPHLHFVIGVWVQQTLSLKPTFKQVVDIVYKAASNQVDFENKVSSLFLFQLFDVKTAIIRNCSPPFLYVH